MHRTATEDMLSTSQNDMNMRLQKQTERSWIEPVVWYQSFVPCFTDQMGSLPIWFTFSHIWVKQNYTFFFFYIYIIYLYIIHHSKDKMKSFENNTCPFIAHHWFTKIFWALLRFQQTAAFHYKKVVWIQTPTQQMKKHDVQMENRKLFFF